MRHTSMIQTGRWFLNLFILVCVTFFPLFSQTDVGKSVEITFKSQGHSLKGRFFQSKQGNQGVTLLLLPGFPGGEQDVLGLSQRLAPAGVNVLMFNYSGTHKSEGEFSLEQTQTDIQAAYDYLHQNDFMSTFKIDTSRIILGGYSFGGGMALTYAAQHPEIRRVISIAGNDHGAFAREYSRNPQMAQALDSTFDQLKAPGGPIRFKWDVLKHLAANPGPFDLRICAPNLVSRDVLLVGGWDDLQVTIDHNLLPLYRALKQAGATTVSFVAYHTDHTLRNVREQLASQLIQWIQTDTAKTTR